MSPLPGVLFIQGDLTRAATAQLIRQALGKEGDDEEQQQQQQQQPVGPKTIKEEEDQSMTVATENPLACFSTLPATANLPSAAAAAVLAPGTAAPGVFPARHQRLADLVVCDGAPDVIGMHDVDECIQHSLTVSALNVSVHILREGSGAFVAKIFRGAHLDAMLKLLQKFFASVSLAKPKASRNSSIEGFVVCQGFRGLGPPTVTLPGGVLGDGLQLGQRRDMERDPVRVEEAADRTLLSVPFVSCWDEEQLDSDMSYPLTYTFMARRNNTAPMTAAVGATATAAAAAVAVSSGALAPDAAAAPAASSSYHHLAPAAMPIDPPYRTAKNLAALKNTHKA